MGCVEQQLLELGSRDGRRARQSRKRGAQCAGGQSSRRFRFRSRACRFSEGLERRNVVRLEAEGDVLGRGREPEGADGAAAASKSFPPFFFRSRVEGEFFLSFSS